MYSYNAWQWIFFFYLYCVFGWIFESTYVSLRKKQFVNRGFLRLPMLPLYGTGAMMMLWVSFPVRNNLFLTWLFGAVGATALEYVVGVSMEALFKVRYWDYSDQKFQFQGHICLSSSVAWGILTILMTRLLHRPVEQWVLSLPQTLVIVLDCGIGVVFVCDAAASVKAALDLRQMLEKMEQIRGEFDRLQVQLALGRMEGRDMLEEWRAALREQVEEHDAWRSRFDWSKDRLLQAHPTAISRQFGWELEHLREISAKRWAERKRKKKG